MPARRALDLSGVFSGALDDLSFDDQDAESARSSAWPGSAVSRRLNAELGYVPVYGVHRMRRAR